MYDVIVVGARCAGSPTAMLLARRGYRVLLLDRCTFPSDSMRAHYIQRPGIALLHRWGLLERVVASNCPPIRARTTDLGDFPLTECPPPLDGVDADYAPRRYALDAILAEAAVAAGAELREGFTVQEILADGDRVTGIRGRAASGVTVTETARLVIGADGLHSLVARTVQAPTYRTRPALSFAYYSYWNGVPLAGAEIAFRPQIFAGAFPTNDGLTCVAIQAPVGEFRRFRADIEGNFYAALRQVPALAERVGAGTREERWRGTADQPNFFRKPYGPGWALVGDAGYHKDPITAQGISDAFRDAALLADAVDNGLVGREPLNTALAAYERARNEVASPTYEQTCASAAFAPFPAEALTARAALRAEQPAMDRSPAPATRLPTSAVAAP